MSTQHRYRVLVIDHDAAIRSLLEVLLTSDGYSVHTAADGAESLGKLAEHRPDVILLDLMMPELDGWAFDAAQRLLDRAAEIPTVILSTHYDLPRRTEPDDTPAVFPKPFEISPLLATVRRLTVASSAPVVGHLPLLPVR